MNTYANISVRIYRVRASKTPRQKIRDYRITSLRFEIPAASREIGFSQLGYYILQLLDREPAHLRVILHTGRARIAFAISGLSMHGTRIYSRREIGGIISILLKFYVSRVMYIPRIYFAYGTFSDRKKEQTFLII